MKVSQEPFLLPVDGGHCFCVYRAPADAPASGTILHLPAFGDELNKSRAMTARAARAFAGLGYGVLQVDLVGCGDSSGEHADATMSRWLSNLRDAHAWLRTRCSAEQPSVFWCLRSGALLAAPLLEATGADATLLLWQPLLTGAQQVNHLLRQKVAGDLAGSADRAAMQALRERLRSGETIEVGGYAVSSRLAGEIQEARFRVPDGFGKRVLWFELGAASPPSLSPAARNVIGELQSRGIAVDATPLPGPGFWQSVEIERCDALVEASVRALGMNADVLRRDSAFV